MAKPCLYSSPLELSDNSYRNFSHRTNATRDDRREDRRSPRDTSTPIKPNVVGAHFAFVFTDWRSSRRKTKAAEFRTRSSCSTFSPSRSLRSFRYGCCAGAVFSVSLFITQKNID